MAKKLKSKPGDKQIAEKATDSAQEIWLAGLAAFEQAQKEGSKLFDNLVKEGKKVEARTKELTDVKFDEILEDLKNRASSTWDKLETVLEERVAQALSQLGIPSNEALQELTKRVNELEQRAKELGKTGAASSKEASGPSKAAVGKTGETTKAAVKDDLKTIGGLGRNLDKQLKEYGITTYRQLAQLTEKDIENIEAAGVKIAARLKRENWIEQAKEQHFQKYNERL